MEDTLTPTVVAMVAFIKARLDEQHRLALDTDAPERRVAEIEATRKIVANAATSLDHGWQIGEEARAAVAGLAVRTLQHLVELDAGHPDYDPAWVL
jgi:hypothetical protein